MFNQWFAAARATPPQSQWADVSEVLKALARFSRQEVQQAINQTKGKVSHHVTAHGNFLNGEMLSSLHGLIGFGHLKSAEKIMIPCRSLATSSQMRAGIYWGGVLPSFLIVLFSLFF